MKPVPEREEEGMTPEEQAGAWCARLSLGELSSADRAAFDRWIASTPSHSELFDRALQAWQGLSTIAESPEIIAQRADALDALRSANRKRWSRQLAMGWQWGVGLAAAVVLIVFTFASTADIKPDLYETGLGERRTVVLADGSRLSLDAKSRVSVLYRPDSRELVLLDGRAKFEVAKNPDRPFTVAAGGRTTLATGTAFSVETVGRTLRVVLYEGRVNVIKTDPRSPDGTIGLVPGEELVTDISQAASPSVGRVDALASLAWESGQLNFVEEPLASAVEQLNRYSRVRIVVADARASNIRVSGVFNAGDDRAFIDALTQVYPVRAVSLGSETVIMSKNP